MMIYWLFVWLLILFFLSYQMCGKDFFAPATMLTLTFAFSTVCSIYKYPIWRYSFSIDTMFIILTCLLITICINAFFHKYRIVIKSKTVLLKDPRYVLPIQFKYVIIASVIIAITSLALINQIIRIAGVNGSWGTIMGAFRNNGAYSTNLDNQTPQWIKILQYFINAFSYLFVFDLIFFWKQHSKTRRFMDSIIIVMCSFTGLLSGGRFGMASLLVSIIIMYHLIRIKKTGHFKQYKLGVIIKITLCIILALMLFYYIRNIIGRNDSQGMVSYIAHYFGGGIPSFDYYIHHSQSEPFIWGQETFYSLINNLRRVGLLNISYYLKHHEFLRMNGNSMGNVYTAFRDYYHDFGVTGIFVLHTIFSIFFSMFYEQTKRNGKWIYIIVISIIYYCIVFYPFNNSFFSGTVSIGFAIQLSIVLLLYRLTIGRTIKEC